MLPSFPPNLGSLPNAAAEPQRLSCISCNSWFTAPAELAGLECRCPGCGRKNLVPGRPVAVPETRVAPSARGFRADPRESEQWSVSLSEYRLIEPERAAPEPIHSRSDVTLANAETTLLHRQLPVKAAPLPPPTGPETVEELLAGVQFTVVEVNEGRQLMLQIAAVVLVGGLAAFYGPRLWQQGSRALGLNKLETPPVAVEQPKPQPPTVRRDVPASESSSYTSSSSSSGPWKPFQNRPQSPAQQRPGNSSQRGAAVSQQRPPFRYVQAQPRPSPAAWGETPPPAPRVTSFAQLTRIDTTPTQSFAAASAAEAPADFASVASDAGGGVVGFYRPGEASEDNTFRASLDTIGEPTTDMPEWMRLPTERWPQIMLLNEASFRGHSSAEGTNCVLVTGKGDELWLATSAVALSEIGGVSPAIRGEELRRKLVRWYGVSPTGGSKVVEIKNGSELVIGAHPNCLIMNVPSRSSIGAVKALELRTSRVESGEKLFLVVLPATDTAAQLVYETNVQSGADKEFRVTMKTPVDASSFHGGALIDTNGRLAGIVASANEQGDCLATAATQIASLMK